MAQHTGLTQQLMDEVYAFWGLDGNRGMTRAQVLEVFDLKHKAAVQLGNMNYQVENGGWVQWHENRYSDDLEDVITLARKGTALGVVGFDQIISILMDVRNILADMPATETTEEACAECEGAGYVLVESDEDDDSERSQRCPECRGRGYIEIEQAVDTWSYLAEATDDLDRRYYAIEHREAMFDELLHRFDEPVDISTIASAGKPRCKLAGTDGNVFALMGRVRKTLHDHGMKDQEQQMVERITSQAGDYYHALAIMLEYVDVH
jgi:hypothetical protein